MRNQNICCVYIITNYTNSVLYTGVTGNLARRMQEHKLGTGSKFASKYNCNKLVLVEMFDDIRSAIEREKQIKAGSRKKKVALVEAENPTWRDLSQDIE